MIFVPTVDATQSDNDRLVEAVRKEPGLSAYHYATRTGVSLDTAVSLLQADRRVTYSGDEMYGRRGWGWHPVDPAPPAPAPEDADEVEALHARVVELADERDALRARVEEACSERDEARAEAGAAPGEGLVDAIARIQRNLAESEDQTTRACGAVISAFHVIDADLPSGIDLAESITTLSKYWLRVAAQLEGGRNEARSKLEDARKELAWLRAPTASCLRYDEAAGNLPGSRDRALLSLVLGRLDAYDQDGTLTLVNAILRQVLGIPKGGGE